MSNTRRFMLRLIYRLTISVKSCLHEDPTWFCTIHRLCLLFNIHLLEGGADGTCWISAGSWLSGRGHYIGHGGDWRGDNHGSRYGWKCRSVLRGGRCCRQEGGERLRTQLGGRWSHMLRLLFSSLARNSLYCCGYWWSETRVDIRFRLHSAKEFEIKCLQCWAVI